MNATSAPVGSVTGNASVERTGGVRKGIAERLGLRPFDRVMIVGGYGVRNVGDEAILAGLLTEIPEDIRVSVVSRRPADTAGLHGVQAVSWWSALRLLGQSDVLIVGGGGIFSGHMGKMSRLMPALCLLARSRGVRVAFHGVGVYPSTPWLVRRGIRLLAPHLAAFTVRDRASRQLLESWGLEVEQTEDLSALMPAAPPERGAELFRAAGMVPGRPSVALCLTSTERRIETSLLQVMPEVINALPEVQFCFVPMGQHPFVPHHNDLLLAWRMAKRAPRLSVLTGWHHPSHILSLFQHFDAAVCMRYHSMLFARRAGASVLPVPYAEKCESWMEEYGVPPVRIASADIVKRLETGLQRRRGVCVENTN